MADKQIVPGSPDWFEKYFTGPNPGDQYSWGPEFPIPVDRIHVGPHTVHIWFLRENHDSVDYMYVSHLSTGSEVQRVAARLMKEHKDAFGFETFDDFARHDAKAMFA